MKQLIKATIISIFLLVSLIPQTAQASNNPVDKSGILKETNQSVLPVDNMKKQGETESIKPAEKEKKDNATKTAKTQNNGGGIYISLGGIIIILLILIIIF